MVKPLAAPQALFNIETFILERSLINVEIVVKLFATLQILLNIRKFILERSLINAQNVVKPFAGPHRLLIIREFILDRSLIRRCGKSFGFLTSFSIEFIMGEKPCKCREYG